MGVADGDGSIMETHVARDASVERKWKPAGREMKLLVENN